MGELLHEIRRRPHLMVAYGANLFLSLHYFTTAYVNSSFLNANHVSESSTSILYAVSAVINIILFLFASAIIEVVGSYRQTLYFILLNFIAVTTMALSDDRALIMVAFVVHQAMTLAILFAIDIFAEEGKDKKFVGELRGVFLTVSNIALVSAPIIIASLVKDGVFEMIYILAGVLLLPILLLAGLGFKNAEKHEYKEFNLKQTLSTFLLNKDIRNVFGANVLLQFFYTWMVIYTPLYFINTLGLTWEAFGQILSVALVAFLLIEFPASFLADRKIGEQEMMILGFVIMGVTMCLLPFIPALSTILLMVTFFTSRIGAALVETTTESYFFKKTNENDADLIALFRLARPLSFFIGSLSGGIIIAVLNYSGYPFGYLFIVLGITMFTGIYFASRIVDTR